MPCLEMFIALQDLPTNKGDQDCSDSVIPPILLVQQRMGTLMKTDSADPYLMGTYQHHGHQINGPTLEPFRDQYRQRDHDTVTNKIGGQQP